MVLAVLLFMLSVLAILASTQPQPCKVCVGDKVQANINGTIIKGHVHEVLSEQTAEKIYGHAIDTPLAGIYMDGLKYHVPVNCLEKIE